MSIFSIQHKQDCSFNLQNEKIYSLKVGHRLILNLDSNTSKIYIAILLTNIPKLNTKGMMCSPLAPVISNKTELTQQIY